MPAQDIENASKFYKEALSKLPADLLAKALERVRATHKYGMRLPLPAEIIATVSGEITERHAILRKLTMARLAPVEQPERVRTSDADKARVDAVMSQWRTERSIQEAQEREARREATTQPIYVANPELDEYVKRAREDLAS